MPSQSQTAAADVQPGSGAMFDQIAARYDLLNRLMSLGQDKRWRRRLVASIQETLPEAERDGQGIELLDVATGTADVARALARAMPQAHIAGLDPSPGMLAVGRDKLADDPTGPRITLHEGVAEALPFADGQFAGSCISFGIRNVPDRAAGLREMVRVTRPGGVVAVLELSEPTAALPRWYVHHVVPRLGQWISGAGQEYRYLQASIADFPPPETFAQMMRDAGLTDVTVTPMNFGGVQLFVGRVS